MMNNRTRKNPAGTARKSVTQYGSFKLQSIRSQRATNGTPVLIS
jgi:hypothetical protein